ncbi:MAG TPA: ABC transporter substrate-binding protein [Candidatus Avacidaminococcus intestinavium]|uniref:ABC transporter substrate-binding protein n=1 Tax=Candidatus Avacidaminococcus intestinavium TaxID=2840684 RepID=A0A9D1SKP6_9FIRM|nr:ABC transporter substrate-binding protein [Candidatus Avacidaminococcus intestinavium]
MSVLKKLNLMLSIIIVAVLCVGCAADSFDGAPYKERTAKYLGLRDNTGKLVHLARPPERIVSLALRSDEILLEMVERKRIISLSKWAADPNVSNITHLVGDLPCQTLLSEEHIIALKPDLVIVSQSQPYDLVYRLRSLGIPVFVCPLPRTVQDSKNMILELGNLLGVKERAGEIVAGMEKRLRIIEEKVKLIPEKQRVVVYRFSISGGSGGKNSSFNDVCNLAGVKNAAAQMEFWGTQLMPKEQIVRLNPDVILLPTWDYSGEIDIKQYVTNIIEDPSLQTVKAIKEGRLYIISDKYMLSSSQYMVNAVEDIYEACYGTGKGLWQNENID